MMASAAGNIKVVVRVRPFNARERDRQATCIVRMKDAQTLLVPPPPDGKSKPVKAALEGTKTFAFDKSYWSFDKDDDHYAGQEDLFGDLGRPLLDNAFQGYNNCIFAYGQTGSGKSYSMMGYGDEQGVIPRICRSMFDRIDGVVQADSNMTCTVEVSYLEIYNERVRDLLNPSTKGNLKVREHPSTGPYVEDLAKLVVRSFQEIENLMDEGNKARTVAATNMNETSSRSHAVFTLTLTQKRHDTETNMDTEKVAKISLVDLAGSERATSTGATGARLKEGAEINRSLSTLGRVIAALADQSMGKGKKGAQVPYRDSVLTWLLKDSLGGNSLTSMIAAISPADINFEETLSTLRYADSAKRIKNRAVVNEDPNARMIRELKEELAQLRSKLAGGGGGGVGGVPEEQYAPDTPLEKQFVSISGPDGSVKKVSKAEIAEQLSQSEKLYSDLNQTWEQKMQNTEKIHKEREQALEDLGISIEKGFVGLSTPKKMPHLVNLSDDPLLAECLVYNLKPGTTTVGNVETNPPSSPTATVEHGMDEEEEGQGVRSTVDIRLNGSKILHDHCTFENVDGIVTVVPKDGAAVMVNGVRIEAPKRLRSGYRVILGDFHIFRFNHPQEAREERSQAEQQGSMLKYSVSADEIDSPSHRPAHERTNSNASRAFGDLSPDGVGSPGSESPAPWRYNGAGRDSDWAFARREAVSSILGPDQNLSNLRDDELDVLFDDLQRVRETRKRRPESRVLDFSGQGSFAGSTNGAATPLRETDTDTESVASGVRREKYMSNGTLDNFSLDTALTIPSTPRHGSEQDSGEQREHLKVAKEEMQEQLDQQKEVYEQQLQKDEAGNAEIEEMRIEKAKMEANLQEMKDQMEKQLREQKEAFEQQLAELTIQNSPSGKRGRGARKSFKGEGLTLGGLSDKEIFLAKWVLEHWRRHRWVAMAAAILRNASTLKEAQILSQQMRRNVVFQFTVVDHGHTTGSLYDMALLGLDTDESMDTELDSALKPCLAARVADFGRNVITLWSLDKLSKRLKDMRQLAAYMDRPEYMQHLSLTNPFEEETMPNYSRVGDADIPLAAVFECRVQDFTLDVYSPYTQSVVGIVHLSLEPSSAEAPKETLKFNVVMHELVGFAEREGSEVHAQLFIPGVSDGEDGHGVTTTSLVSGFGEGPVRFESVHSMSLPLSAPREASLRVSVFAKVTGMHLDKLLSWDDMRDASSASERTTGQRPKVRRFGSRLHEREFHIEERHDVFARVQILEIGEDGNYAPVEVVQSSTLDQGAYQLHQGLQRRIVLSLTHSSGDTMPWIDVSNFRACDVRLVGTDGKVQDTDSNQKEVILPLLSPPVIRSHADGAENVKMTAQWDSSAHGSLLLDRPAMVEKYSVQLSLKWEVSSHRVNRPMHFSLDVAIQTRPRTWFRQNSIIAQLWHNQRVVRSTAGNFSVRLKPAAAKKVGDLWRMDTTGEYITGEELLSGWAPRGISLIRDFVGLKKRQRRVQEIESGRGLLSMSTLLPPAQQKRGELNEQQQALIKRVLSLWHTNPSVGEIMLLRSQTGSPESSPKPNRSPTSDTAEPSPQPLTALVEPHAKTPTLLKGGWLLTPDASGTRWVKRYVELRKPYLHLYSADGDEVGAINLTNSRVDAEPQVARLLRREGVRLVVWAVWAVNQSWLFARRTRRRTRICRG
ncbi:kinesin-domain-containing protein [Teratosphaeria nubilosa]|uniref:Kinesin-domain-containing protein n=1 Tax=Teratosphaeria nubilosa TaxID=161662 RepID=A0A6G1LK57_9PEZI|nr:kinesin-domain-containing protein [Teratosphaeria nubilosa]